MTVYWFLIITALGAGNEPSISISQMPNEAICGEVAEASKRQMMEIGVKFAKAKCVATGGSPTTR